MIDLKKGHRAPGYASACKLLLKVNIVDDLYRNEIWKSHGLRFLSLVWVHAINLLEVTQIHHFPRQFVYCF